MSTLGTQPPVARMLGVLLLLASCDGSVVVLTSGAGASGSGGEPSTSGEGGTGGALPEEPTLEATGKLDPIAIVADQTAIYWCNRGTNVDNQYPKDDGAIMKLPFDGSGIVTLAQGGSPQDLAMDDDFVYWTAAKDMVLYLVPKEGGSVSVAAVDNKYMHLVAVDDARVYYTISGPEIRSYPKEGSGGGITLVEGEGVGSPQQLAVDATHVYWTSLGSQEADFEDGFVARVPKAGGEVTVLAAGQARARALAVDDTSVYWSMQGPDSKQASAILVMPKQGGEPVTIASGQNTVHDIGIDGPNLYWGDYLGGPLSRAHLPDGSTTVLQESATAVDVAVGPSRLYWIDPYSEDLGRIFSISK